MKLHTNLDEYGVRAALVRAQESGDVPGDVTFDLFTPAGSRSHRHAWDIHLATARSGTRSDDRKRRTAAYAGGNGLKYAATWEEWGWFLAEFFAADPGAKAGAYKSKADFHARTGYAFASGPDEMPDDEITAMDRRHRDHVGFAAAIPDPDATLARIDSALDGPSLDPAVFGPESRLARTGY